MQMKLRSLMLLTLLLSTAFAKSKDYKNSIQLHPLFPAGTFAGLTFVEVDYVRYLNEDFSLLIKAKETYDKFLYWHGLDSLDQEGRHIKAELEIGIRRNYTWAQSDYTFFGPYIQLSSSNGYQDLYYEEYEDIDTSKNEVLVLRNIESFEGYSGSVGVTGGLLLRHLRFVLSIDLGIGLKFNPVPGISAGPGFFKPNIAMGFCF